MGSLMFLFMYRVAPSVATSSDRKIDALEMFRLETITLNRCFLVKKRKERDRVRRSRLYNLNIVDTVKRTKNISTF